MRMAEIMESDPTKPVFLEQPLERLAERMEVDRLLVLLRHDEVPVLVSSCHSAFSTSWRGRYVRSWATVSASRSINAGTMALRRRLDHRVANGDGASPHDLGRQSAASFRQRIERPHGAPTRPRGCVKREGVQLVDRGTRAGAVGGRPQRGFCFS
jgi:hypothetical protein